MKKTKGRAATVSVPIATSELDSCIEQIVRGAAALTHLRPHFELSAGGDGTGKLYATAVVKFGDTEIRADDQPTATEAARALSELVLDRCRQRYHQLSQIRGVAENRAAE
jgi:hypothetical protein